jgi:sialate O-acetylesterase
MKFHCFTSICFAAVMVCFTAIVRADVRLPEIFADNMVLQQDMPVPIWGWADPGEEIMVNFGHTTPSPDDAALTRLSNAGVKTPGEIISVLQTASTTADANGKWSVQLPPLKASAESATLTIKGKNEIKLTNVLVGDVWLCSGQSNMEWSMTQSDKAEYEEVLKNVDNPHIRLFHVRRTFSADPLETLSVTASWKSASAESIPNFSAVALHFGRKLQAELGVPIGLINASWGGTRIEPWTPPVGFQTVPALKNIADELESRNPQSETYTTLANKTLQEYRTWLDEASNAAGRIPIPPKFPDSLIPYSNQQQPAVLYNSMIHPFVPFAIKGVIWYQGESNMGEGMVYAEKMKALIQGWRTVFNNPDLGFYYVQLAPYIYGDNSTRLPEFWEAQSSVEKILPKTGQAIINDTVDDLRDIHPVRKKPVGERLALLALNRTYGKSEVAAASPELERMEIEGNTITLHFKNAQGLKVRDGKPEDWFEVADAHGIFYTQQKFLTGVVDNRPDGVIDGTTITLTSGVPKPLAIRYAWNQSAQPNIVNEAGLPLGAFRAGEIPDRALFDELIPDGKQFQVLYRFDPTKPELADNRHRFIYATDNSAQITGKVKRVGYFLALYEKNKMYPQFIFVTMPPLDPDLKKLGVPVKGSGARFQKRIQDVQVVASNVPSVKIGLYNDCNVEFWDCNYSPENSANIPGASRDKHDFGDSMSTGTSPGYGSMQIHDIAGKQTLLAFNNFGAGMDCDIGIGNNPDPNGHPDWTFSKSAASYTKGQFLILVEME